MKKSFAENCIRYISTATALILALAMLCCANFSAGAKTLGSNLTITDTTSLLEDINTTTNTTLAKTKDLIASGAGVEIISGGATQDTVLYFAYSGSYDVWPENWGGTNNGSSYQATAVTGETFDGKQVYSCALWSDSKGANLHFKSGNTEVSGTGIKNIINGDGISNYKDKIYVLTSETSGSWQNYSGGSSTTSSWTLRGEFNKWSETAHIFAGSGNTLTTSVELAANTTYKFKLNDGTNWYGNTGTMTSTNCTGWEFTGSGGDAKITTANAGTYVFTLDTSTKKLSVTYPSVNTYTVTFNANGHGTAPPSQTVTSGGTATAPTAPTASGYTFGGWYTEAGCTNEYNFSTAVTGNITLYAKWTKNATSEVPENILEILNGTKVMSYYGYDNSWNTGSKIYVNDGKKDVVEGSGQGTVKISNVDYRYAGFTMPTGTNLTNYNISDKTYSSWSGCQMNVTEPVGGAFYYIQGTDNKVCNKIDPTTAQTSLGATSFTVGTTDKLSVKTRATKATSSTGNALKYQYYIKNGTNYIRLGSTDIAASTSDTTTNFDISTLPKGTYELITMLYDGYIYYVSDTTETDTFTISDSYTVTFNANGHGDNTEATVEPGGTVSAPTPAPTATGYTFGGWYRESTCKNEYDFNTPVTGDLTLYAKWTANQYTVSFNSNGGDDTPDSITVTYGGTYAGLPTSAGTKTGHTFAGWYTSATGGTEVNSSTVVKITSDQTLYAHWTAKEYTITYMSDGSQLSDLNPTKYTYGVGVPTLPTPSKEGYTFVGWYNNEGLTGDPVTSISNTATENKTFYAKWELNAFKHQYVFLDTTKKGWILSGGCKVYISFDDGNSYTKMNELFTNDSGYDTTNKNSKLLFAKVPDNTTKFIFRRQNTSGTYNETPYLYSNFKNNNLLTLQDDINAGNNNIDGTWSTVDYTPVPINFNVGENGKVYLINTKIVDMPVANGTSTIYADKSATLLKIKATPDAENGYELNTFNVNGVDKARDISDKSAGGTVDVDALGDTNTVEVTFKASKSPKIKVPKVANSTIELTYTDPDGTPKIGTEFDTEYTIKYNSTFTLEITPASGYYVESLGDNLSTSETLPKAGIITATQKGTGVRDELLSLSYVIKANPTVTIKCFDRTGKELKSDVGITVEGGAGALTTQTKSVLYNSETGVTFAANVTTPNSYQFIGFYTQAPTEENPLVDENKITTDEKTLTGCKASATNNNLTVKKVTSNVTLYAIFSQQYKITFSYTNLKTFAVYRGGVEVPDIENVYVSQGEQVTMSATVTDDYKLTSDCWTISSESGGGTLTSTGLNATYVAGSQNVTITITPKVATYTGEGKWGSKLLRIETSDVNGDEPWFAAKFEVVKDSNTTYEWVRFSEVTTDNYECVIPDNAVSVMFCRMAKKATSFTEETEGGTESEKAWNVTTSTPIGNTDEKYILYFDKTDNNNWVFKARKDSSK